MTNHETITAIILIAGNSTRFGTGNNKNLIEMNQKPVFYYSLEQFLKHDKIDKIIIVVKESEIAEVKKMIDTMPKEKDIQIIVGGNSRQESVYHAITQTKSTYVIIQDGARPMLTQEYITNCIHTVKKDIGCTIGVKSKDTIKITDDEGIVISSTQRKNTWVIQTPQCFHRETLQQAHERNKDRDDITDDCMLFEIENYQVKIIEGKYNNIKLTTKEDLEILESYIEKK